MSVTAGILDDWYLEDIDTAIQVYPVVQGSKSVYMKREHYILTISRKFVGMTAFYEEVGNKRSSFSFKTGADSNSSYSSSKRKWMCTKDSPKITDSITGEGQEVQVWEHWTDEEEMPESEYKVSEKS